MHAALHDAEQRLVGALVRGQAALGPFPRQVDGTLDEFPGCRIRRALVELHCDIRADALLDVHVVSGVQKCLLPS